MNNRDKPIDRLVDQSRTLGSGRVIRDPANVTPEQASAVVRAYTEFQMRTRISNAKAARSIGASEAALTAMVRGERDGNWQDLAVDLDRWLEDELKRENAPKPTDFVWTTVAEEVLAVAEATIELKTIGLVYGDTGIGKTLALKAVAAEKPGTVFVSVETACASSHGLIEAIGHEICGTSLAKWHQSRQALVKIKEQLKGTPRLLIIDEVHKLCSDSDSDRALNVIRDLHDHTEIPILLSGSTDLVAYLERRQTGGREPLGQIRSRIGIRRDLCERSGGGSDGGPLGAPLFSAEEVRKVFAKSKMRLASDAVGYLMQLANLPGSGGLRACRNIVVMATKIHQSRASELTADMLRSVHAMLVNRRAFEQVEARMEEARPVVTAKIG
ncbi:AAA family ATPase [Humisphaera borealis]|uniref:AAA family ATPase n=1 Tax=Humisphaera borealis TaxID=2807512 RepID=A0A7M2WUG2_9BACT|nr:AAA family ATPase [Humisphaera borealis]QOV88431.1 AAA family ATPase [Humisphaera borealis]